MQSLNALKLAPFTVLPRKRTPGKKTFSDDDHGSAENGQNRTWASKRQSIITLSPVAFNVLHRNHNSSLFLQEQNSSRGHALSPPTLKAAPSFVLCMHIKINVLGMTFQADCANSLLINRLKHTADQVTLMIWHVTTETRGMHEADTLHLFQASIRNRKAGCYY